MTENLDARASRQKGWRKQAIISDRYLLEVDYPNYARQLRADLRRGTAGL